MKQTKKCMNCKKNEEGLLTYMCRNLGHELKFCEMDVPLPEAQTLDKATTIVMEGDEINKNIFWLQSGYARYLKVWINDEGIREEDTVDFCRPGKLLFIRECAFDLQLAAKTVIIPFPQNYQDALKLDESKVGKLTSKILAKDRPEGLMRMMILKMKPRERYMEFLKFFGVDIEQYFAIKHIASFLGMRPSYLSRLRGEFHKKKTGGKKYLQTVFFIMEFV